MNTREELLQGLYEVRNQITKILQTYDTQRKIVSSYRKKQENISTSGVKNQTKLLFFIIAGAIGLFYLIIGLIAGDFSSLLLYGVCIAIIYKNKKKKSLLRKLALILFVCTVLSSVMVIISNPFTLVLFAIDAVVTSIIVKKIIGKQNEKIDVFNEQVEAENAKLHQQYDQTVTALNTYRKELAVQSEGWYPPSYCSIDAVNFFIEAVENYRVDTVKEMVNLYEKSEHYRRMEKAQKDLVAGQEKIIAGQKETIAQLKFANVMHIMNLSMQAQTQDMIRENTSAINSVGQKVGSLNSKVDSLNSKVDGIRNFFR